VRLYRVVDWVDRRIANRRGADRHGDRGEAADADDAGAGGKGDKASPRRVDGSGGVDCRRVYGWRAMHAVSLGHENASSWLGLEPGRKLAPFPSACIYGTTIFMKKSIKVAPKKSRGRPPSGGRDPHVTLRMPRELIAEADAWAAAHDTVRSEAIRRLVELGLAVKTPARLVSKPGRRLRAQELATKAIEKIVDPAAPPEERAQRRRHLTKGPEEFREVRVDRPKAKK
jgi:hypothetical protein